MNCVADNGGEHCSSTDQFLAAAAAAKTNEKLGEENKGHMLLKKMG